MVPYWLALLAGACSRNDQAEEGLAAITEALIEIERTSERFWEAELTRLKGQFLLEGDADKEAEAEACFQSAIEIAQSQEARSWELRTAGSLAGLWRDQNKPKAAYDLLVPVYAAGRSPICRVEVPECEIED